MSARSRFAVSVGCFLAFAVVAGLLLSEPAMSQQDKKSDGNWEYTTVSIDAAELQRGLDELGKDGWDVFSIVRADSSVGQGNDGKTHITAHSFQVSGKRRK